MFLPTASLRDLLCMYAVKGVGIIIHACSNITLQTSESFGNEMRLIEQQLDRVLWSNRRRTGKKGRKADIERLVEKE